MEKELIAESQIILNAPVDIVWKALTQPEYTVHYMFNCKVSSNWNIGDTITWQGNFNGYEAFQIGKILAYQKEELITYSTFDKNYGLEDKPENYVHVSYCLESKNDQTVLTVISQNFSGSSERYHHAKNAWENLVLPQLKEFIEEKLMKTEK